MGRKFGGAQLRQHLSRIFESISQIVGILQVGIKINQM